MCVYILENWKTPDRPITVRMYIGHVFSNLEEVWMQDDAFFPLKVKASKKKISLASSGD